MENRRTTHTWKPQPTLASQRQRLHSVGPATDAPLQQQAATRPGRALTRTRQVRKTGRAMLHRNACSELRLRRFCSRCPAAPALRMPGARTVGGVQQHAAWRRRLTPAAGPLALMRILGLPLSGHAAAVAGGVDQCLDRLGPATPGLRCACSICTRQHAIMSTGAR